MDTANCQTICGVELTLDTTYRFLIAGHWVEGAVNETTDNSIVVLYSLGQRGRRDAIHFPASAVQCIVVVGQHPEAGE